MSFTGRLLREPLVHFLVLGGLLFALGAWQEGGAGAGSNRVTITPGVVEHLATGFATTWRRPPDDVELKGLVDDYVKDEIAAREAVALGLDRDDTIIRRRLRQKLEFLLADEAAVPPRDADLEAWLARHPEVFRLPAQVAFRQVYLRPDRHGKALAAEAARLLVQLRAGGPEVATARLGDATMLPADAPLMPLPEVARTFGDGFAEAVAKMPPGQWSGPIESSYGTHLVLLRERRDAAAPALAEVRSLVLREVEAERRRAAQDALYDRILKKYVVTIELPAAVAPSTPAPASGSGAGPGPAGARAKAAR